MQVQNISPLGNGRILPGLDNLFVPIGGVIDVDDDFGVLLCEQVDVWAPHGEEAITVFVEFCTWIAAVKEAERNTVAKADEFVPAPVLTNPALERLRLLKGGAVPAPAAAVLVGDVVPETIVAPETVAAVAGGEVDAAPAEPVVDENPKPAGRRRDAAAAADKDGE